MEMPFSRANRNKVNLALISLSYIGCFMYGFVATGRGIIFPDLLQTFHLSDTEGSLFFSLASATGLAANLLTYKWYPRLGPIKAMTLFSAMFAFGVFLVSFAHAFEVTLIGAAVLGFSMSGSSLLVNLLASQATTDSTLRRQVISGLHAAFGIASMLAPLFVNALVQFGLDWRMIFAVLGLAPVLITFQSMSTSEIGTNHEWKTAFTEHKPWRRALWYATICAIYVSIETMIGTRLVLYARRDLGFDVETANVLLSVFFLGFFLGRIQLTFFKFKHSNMAILYLSATVSFILFFIGLYVNPWALAACGLGFSVFYPCLMALLTDELGEATPFAMTWCQAAQSGAAIVMHLAVGVLSDRFGLGKTLLIGPLFFAIVIALLLLGRPNEPQAARA